jgi:hypothetical protein
MGAKSGIRNDPTLLTMRRGDLCLFYTSEGGLGQNQYNWTTFCVFSVDTRANESSS